MIAVDGPAASGKGTIAARLAAHYGLPHLDTGRLYRAVGLAVLDAGHKAVAIERGLPTVWQQPDLRIVSAADEHARMEYPAGRATPEIGERLRLIPGHCDPTVDRFDWYVCVRAGRVESVWPITARGGMQ